ncbi:hypothetical protein ANTPLA_LOCUS3349 [Anthophora plagiata]
MQMPRIGDGEVFSMVVSKEETSGSWKRRAFVHKNHEAPFVISRTRFASSRRVYHAAHVVADYLKVYVKDRFEEMENCGNCDNYNISEIVIINGGTDHKSCNTVVGRRYGLPTGAYRYTQALCRTEVEYGLYWRHLLHG